MSFAHSSLSFVSNGADESFFYGLRSFTTEMEWDFPFDYQNMLFFRVSGGELFHYLSERDHLSEEDASKFVQQLLFGLDHLHVHNIAHLDLKPENILLSSAESQIIKIIDFGLAKKIDPGGKEIKCMMGTAEFVAPEVVNYEPLSLQSDMWSVGVITYMLLSGSSPFMGQDQQETFANITRAEFDFVEDVFSTTSDLAKDFIR